MATIKTKQTNPENKSVGEEVVKLKPLYTVGGNVKGWNHYGKQWFLKKLKIELCVCSVISDSLQPHGLTYNLPGSSLHGILQARILEWIAIVFSRRSSQPRDRTRVSYIAGRFFTIWATREAYDLIIPFLGIFPLPKLKIFESWDICIPIRHCLQWPKGGSNTSVHRQTAG